MIPPYAIIFLSFQAVALGREALVLPTGIALLVMTRQQIPRKGPGSAMIPIPIQATQSAIKLRTTHGICPANGAIQLSDAN